MNATDTRPTTGAAPAAGHPTWCDPAECTVVVEPVGPAGCHYSVATALDLPAVRDPGALADSWGMTKVVARLAQMPGREAVPVVELEVAGDDVVGVVTMMLPSVAALAHVITFTAGLSATVTR